MQLKQYSLSFFQGAGARALDLDLDLALTLLLASAARNPSSRIGMTVVGASST